MEELDNWHGVCGDESWAAPRCAVFSEQAVRPDQKNMMTASEYVDDEKVLQQKVAKLAEMLRSCKNGVVYSGAGLSRASGIADYASKEKTSLSGEGAPKLRSPLDAEPTLSHCVIAQLVSRGFIGHIVNQNHDGLAQKAGVPEQVVNEIHGAWFDPSNPVVQFGGTLRDDLFRKLVETEESADFCICVGTSLSGMNADRIPVSTAKRFVKKRKGLGTVMINLQRTHLDASCSLRIWGKADQVFSLLAKEMGIPAERIPLPVPCERTLCPYDETGNRATDGRLMLINIEPEQRIEVGQRTDNTNRHRVGRVERIDEKGHAYVILEGAKGKLARPAVLGSWWMQAAALGTVDVIPLRNEHPVYLEQNDPLCNVEFNCRAISEKNWEWSLECNNACPLRIKQVTYKLHPTFTPSVVVLEGNANKLTRTGWGTFVVPIEITFEDSSKVNVEYQLDFMHAKNVQIVPLSQRKF